MNILIPEYNLLETIKTVLTLIRNDYKNHTNKEKTILHRMFGVKNKLERYNFYEQAKTVIIGEAESGRVLDVNLFFNMKRIEMPTIHITLPQELTGEDGIGIDEGYIEPDFEVEDDITTYRKVYTRRFDTTFNLVVTSNNTNEVVLVYNFLKAILIPVFNHLNQIGLENCRLTGGDLNISPNLIPPNVYARSLNLSLSYDFSVQDFYDIQTVSNLLFSSQSPDTSDSAS